MSFWGSGDYGLQPALDARTVKDAERLLGVRLPPSLLDVLHRQNGRQVATRWNAFPTAQPTSWSADHVPFDELWGIDRRECTTSLLDSPHLVKECELPSPLVLLIGDGHWWIALDYRECGAAGEPAVTWFDTELGDELRLADDFRSFLEGLAPRSGFDDGI